MMGEYQCWSDDGRSEELDIKPMTAEQARDWERRHPGISLWRVVVWQLVVGSIVALLAWLLSGRAQVGLSAGYGALAVVLPAAVFALAMTGRGRLSGQGLAASVLLRFFGWEVLKLLLTIGMLFMAPKVLSGLSWIGLLVGFVLVIKVYWVALVLPGMRCKLCS
jgi:ATP synthase protein I